MELTPEERAFVEPYLAMKVGQGKGWVFLLVLGLVICAVAVVLRLSGRWPNMGHYFLLILVFGMVVIEIALNMRQKSTLARIFQKYEAALRQAQAGEEEETA